MEGFQGDYIHLPDDEDNGYLDVPRRDGARTCPHTKKIVDHGRTPALTEQRLDHVDSGKAAGQVTPSSIPANWDILIPPPPFIVISLTIMLAAYGFVMHGIGGALLGAGSGAAIYIGLAGLNIMILGRAPRSNLTKGAARHSDPWPTLLSLDRRRMAEAKKRCDAFLALAGEAMPTTDSPMAVVTIQDRLPEIVESFKRASRHASSDEIETLKRDLLDTVERISLYADQHRQELLTPLLSDFETNKRYLEARVGQPELAPIQEPEPATDEVRNERSAKHESLNDVDNPWTAACDDIPF